MFDPPPRCPGQPCPGRIRRDQTHPAQPGRGQTRPGQTRLQRSWPGHWSFPALGLVVAAALGMGFWSGLREPAFTTVLAQEPWIGQALAGKVIVIDPGHGGPDGGATGLSGAREEDIVLAVSLQLRDLLKTAGARPVLTRETDTDLRDQAVPGEGSRRRGELAARVRVAETNGAHAFLSIHANRFGHNTPWKGAQVFYDPQGRPEGERLARLVQEALREQTHTTRSHRPIEQFVLRRSPVPAANVEIGFLSNAQEERMLKDPAYQAKLARAIVIGLARYFAAS